MVPTFYVEKSDKRVAGIEELLPRLSHIILLSLLIIINTSMELICNKMNLFYGNKIWTRYNYKDWTEMIKIIDDGSWTSLRHSKSPGPQVRTITKPKADLVTYGQPE